MQSLLSIPNGFSVFGFKIHFYGITTALGYLLGVFVAVKNAKKRGFKTEDILTLACYVIPFCVIGARLCFVFTHMDHFTNFWDIFKVWEGGLIFYGGVIGGALALLVYCLIHKKKFLAATDILVPGLLIGQALGRWGNFFNQEAYGYPITNPSFQWFPIAVFIDNCFMEDCTCSGSGWHMATFFYEGFLNLLIFAFLMFLLYRHDFKQNGIITSMYMILYGIVRFFVEGLRTDSVPLGSARFSQIFSLLLIGCGLSLLLFFAIRHHLKTKNQDTTAKIIEIIKKDI